MAGPRSQARRYAVLALYQWQLTGQDPVEIALHYLDDPAWIDAVSEALVEGNDGEGEDQAAAARFNQQLFKQLLYGVPKSLTEIDERLRPALDRPLEQVDPVEQAILRVGAYELLHSPEVPGRVIINEAVELAKLLGAEQGHRFINGVLDRVTRAVRGQEIPRRPGTS